MRLCPLLYLLVILVASSCTLSKKARKSTEQEAPKPYQFSYDLQKPDVTFDLPKSLREVSGIAFTKGNKEIVAVQDEQGILFYLDKKTGKLLRERKFHKNGDYEDIEVVGDVIYVIKSSGSLYKLEEDQSGELIRTKYKLGEFKEYDMEGLCYDAVENRLLIACKGILSKEEAYQFHKGAYALDIETMSLDENHACAVSLNSIEAYIETKEDPELKKTFEKILTVKNGVLGFSPAAIAIHPLSHNIYMVSSKGKTLMVIDKNSNILHLEKLNKKIHAQPEGLLFDTDGTLYISNEAKDAVAKIYSFSSGYLK